MINLLWTILFSVASSVLYRCGGSDKRNKWYDFMLNTKARDVGCALCVVGLLSVAGFWQWSLVLCFGLMWGALSSYHKYVGYLFNRPDKSTVYWESWLMTGFCYGLAMLPYAIQTGSYLGFGIRCALLAAFVCLWCTVIKHDVISELGRGFAIVATLPLLFI